MAQKKATPPGSYPDTTSLFSELLGQPSLNRLVGMQKEKATLADSPVGPARLWKPRKIKRVMASILGPEPDTQQGELSIHLKRVIH